MALPINIEDLLSKQCIESNRIEFKKSWNPSKIYQSICAFANDFDNIGGGYILVGVEEVNGRAVRPVLGLPEAELDRIQREMVGYNNKIKPFYLPRPSIEEVDGKYILAIWVPAGQYRPYEVLENVTSSSSKSRWYIRYGTSSMEAKGEILDELRNLANRTPFDDRGNPEIALQDLSAVLIQDYLRRVKSRLSSAFTKLSVDEVLEQLDLYVGPEEQRYLKNVAAMMFCETPERFFPYTAVDIVIYPNGAVQDPDNLIEVPRITGSVYQMIRATLDYLRLNVIKERIHKKRDRAEAVRYFNYPYQAIEEAVVNALYHRDYQQREPVEISVEPHEISILSYAGPDRSISEDAIKAAERLRARRYRNRRLGDFLKELKLSEGRATGIPTIQKELQKNGSAPARIETDVDRSYFLISIPCHPDFIEDTLANDQMNGTVNGTVKSKLERRLEGIIRQIRIRPEVTADELSHSMGVSYRTIRRDLKRLSEDKLIARVGSDKAGRWMVLLDEEE